MALRGGAFSLTHQPTVLVDIDDTLADTQTAVLQWVNAQSPQQYSYRELTREHREKNSGHYYEMVQQLLNSPDDLQVEPYTNALEALKQLHRADYEIHIASARKESLHQLTLDWLKRHGFVDYVKQVHPRSSKVRGHEFKVMVAGNVKPEAAFDDTLEVAEALAESGVTVYLIDKPWNTSDNLPQNIIRTPDFASAVSQFLKASRASAPRN